MTAVLNLLMGSLMKEGLGGDYESKKGTGNAVNKEMKTSDSIATRNVVNIK